MFLGSGAPGVIVALVRGESSFVRGMGETTKGNGQEPDGRSLFRIGSISKAMAGELLTDLVVEGKVRLSDPLQRFAPAGRTVPSADDRDHATGSGDALSGLAARHCTGAGRTRGPDIS